MTQRWLPPPKRMRSLAPDCEVIAAIIPARGGSKGIPRKNILRLGGKPLIAWSIGHAKLAAAVERVIVSTDDDDIAGVAKDCAAEVIFRPPDMARDDSPSEEALRHALKQLDEQPELVVFLQPTSPIRQADDVDRAILTLEAAKADSVFSCRLIEGYTWRLDGHVAPNYLQRKPRQKWHNQVLEENGSIYVFKPWVLANGGERLGGIIAPYYMHPLDSFQLDEPDDIPLFEALIRVRCN